MPLNHSNLLGHQVAAPTSPLHQLQLQLELLDLDPNAY
jgi:hypothetical protein